MKNNKYFRYKLTFPYAGTKIYKSNSLSTAAHKCYQEFTNLNDVKDGIFGIVNIDTNDEHKFKASDGTLYKYNKKNQNNNNNNNNNQKGGNTVDFIELSKLLSPESQAQSQVHTKTLITIPPKISLNPASSSSINLVQDIQESSAMKSVTNPETNQEDNIYNIINSVSNKINEEIKNPTVDNNKHLTVINESPINVPMMDNVTVLQDDNSQDDDLDDHASGDHDSDEQISTFIDTPAHKGSAALTHMLLDKQNLMVELLGEINKNVYAIKDNFIKKDIGEIINNELDTGKIINDEIEKPNKYLQDIENPDGWDCVIF